MNKVCITTFLALSALSLNTQAEDFMPSFLKRADNSPLTYQLRAGYSSGGEKIGPAISDSYGQSRVSAGSGVLVGAGFTYDLKTTYPMFVETNISILADQASSNDSNVTFTRIPMDFMLGSRYRKLRFAVGLTHHANPTLKMKWDEDGENNDKEESTEKSYGGATGQVIELSYNLQPVDLNLRYTNIEYDFAGVKVDGSGMAVSIMLRF